MHYLILSAPSQVPSTVNGVFWMALKPFVFYFILPCAGTLLVVRVWKWLTRPQNKPPQDKQR